MPYLFQCDLAENCKPFRVTCLILRGFRHKKQDWVVPFYVAVLFHLSLLPSPELASELLTQNQTPRPHSSSLVYLRTSVFTPSTILDVRWAGLSIQGFLRQLSGKSPLIFVYLYIQNIQESLQGQENPIPSIAPWVLPFVNVFMSSMLTF